MKQFEVQKDFKDHLVPAPFFSIPITVLDIPQLVARLLVFQSFWLKTILGWRVLDGQSSLLAMIKNMEKGPIWPSKVTS